jgi:hypothetical protein
VAAPKPNGAHTGHIGSSAGVPNIAPDDDSDGDLANVDDPKGLEDRVENVSFLMVRMRK